MRVALLILTACSFEHGATSQPGSPDGRTPDSPVADSSSDGSNVAPTCSDGVRNGTELDIDCGGPACSPCTTIFAGDANTLALFELNGSLADSSGNGRDATLIGGSFVTTSWGMGFALPGQQTQGFQWNPYASLLAHPYTVEMVVTPQSVACWKKLYGPADSGDAGWYYCGGLQSFPSQSFGPTFTANQRHYIAIVSLSATSIRAYVNGTSIGTSNNFTTPAAAAIFFRDDTNTNRTEVVTGVVDALRISNTARTANEIQAVQARLAAQP